ncbi:MAG: hypothetical protein ACRD2J_16030 [Thermoanaerobaculia bacterium]
MSQLEQPRERETASVEERAFVDLPPAVLDEVIRQFRAARNDILRYGLWNVRNLTDEDFNRIDDRKLFDYFRQDLLETRFLSKGRRVDLLQVWGWFDDQMSGAVPLLVGGREEHILHVRDKDLDKVRKRIGEVASFMPILRAGDFDSFRKVKYKLRRTVLRLTYELHHLSKRLDKHRRTTGPASRMEHIAEPAPPELAAVGPEE